MQRSDTPSREASRVVSRAPSRATTMLALLAMLAAVPVTASVTASMCIESSCVAERPQVRVVAEAVVALAREFLGCDTTQAAAYVPVFTTVDDATMAVGVRETSRTTRHTRPTLAAHLLDLPPPTC